MLKNGGHPVMISNKLIFILNKLWFILRNETFQEVIETDSRRFDSLLRNRPGSRAVKSALVPYIRNYPAGWWRFVFVQCRKLWKTSDSTGRWSQCDYRNYPY